MSRRIPTSWEDDDWITPSASSSVPVPPPVVVTPTQQPKTFYKPELTILRRAPVSTTPDPQILKPQSSDQKEKERKEKERKDRERRYQEAKERIFNEKQPSKSSSPSPASSRPGSSTSSPNRGRRKRGDANENNVATSANSTASTPTIMKPPAPPASGSGAIVGFTLNAGRFAPAPTRTRQEWQIKQVALDGKMLESQAEAYGFADNQPLEGVEQGLDWDEFRRDTPKDVEDRIASLDIGSREPLADKENKIEGDGGRGRLSQPVREPKGPEEGKGFGRGRGRRQVQ